jgi:mannose-6-phosphate isomerase
MEIMANSDNVLRGGLTTKHIDVPELLNVLKFEETLPEVLTPEPVKLGIRRYKTPSEEFELSEITVENRIDVADRGDRGVEILFCLRGEARAVEVSRTDPLILTRGMSMIVPGAVNGYSLEGKAVFYRASMGG